MHPADELAYEQDYRESDPLNLDGSAMVDPDRDEDTLGVFVAEFDKQGTFYRKAADEAPEWKKRIFPGGYEAVVVKIDLAGKMLVEFGVEGAEYVLKEAIESYDYMEERISDWATD